MAKKFVLKSKASSEATKKELSKGGGGKGFKFKKTITKLLILPPVEEDSAIFETIYKHTLWGAKGPLASCSSPMANGETDKIHQMGWDVQKKYSKNKDEKLKGFFRSFLVDEKHAINVLDLNDIEAGAQTLQMPSSVADVVLQEFADVVENDYTDICDLDEGRILQITTNGDQGTKKVRYTVVKFLKNTAGLRESGLVDEDMEGDLIENMPNLKKLQPKYNEKEFEDFLKKVMKEGEKLGIDFDDLSNDEEEVEDEDEIVDEELADDDELETEDELEEEEFEDDFDDDFEEEEEEEVVEPIRRAAKKKVSKKKVAKKTRSRE
jgi:hypothetical protein